MKEVSGQLLCTLKGCKALPLSPLLASLDIRANTRTQFIKMFLLQNSKKLSDMDGDADFSIGGKKDLN